MRKIFDFFSGYVSVYIENKHSNCVLDKLVFHSIPFSSLKKYENGDISFFILRKDCKSFEKITENIPKSYTSKNGVPYILYKYRHRLALFIGIFFILFTLISSSFFVWDINVVGNETLLAKDVIENLEELGLKIGSFKPSIDPKQLALEYLLKYDDVSWIAINIKGTVATVELRQRKEDIEIESKAPSNIIANTSGEIYLLEIASGKSTVNIGDYVTKGQILVSGVIDSEVLGFNLVRSNAEIYAKTKESFRIEIPFNSTEKIYTGKEIVKKSYEFFSNNISFGKNSVENPEKYDIITTKEKLYIFDAVELPIYVCKAIYKEFEYAEKNLSEEQAKNMAYAALWKEYSERLFGAEILEKEEFIEITDTSFIIKSEILCIKNIAQEIKIITD